MLPLPISPNIPRLYTAIAEWLSCIICLRLLRPRISTKKIAFISVGVLTLQSVLFCLTPHLNNILWILFMTIALLIMWGFIYLCAEVNWRDAAYYAIRSFIIAEFAASCEWQFELLLINHEPPITLPGYLFLSYVTGFFLPYLISCITIIIRRKKML